MPPLRVITAVATLLANVLFVSLVNKQTVFRRIPLICYKIKTQLLLFFKWTIFLL